MRHDDASVSISGAAAGSANLPDPVELAANADAAPVAPGGLKVEVSVQQVIPGPDGVVTLPLGVDLSDIRVVGRNLVIDLPDGTQMVIVDGAVFVPQLVIGGIEVPAANLAALLIESEPKPAAGRTLSSGGNFAVDVPPLDPGVPLGDLIPPTELSYTPPEFREVNAFEDDEPDVVVEPDGEPVAVDAVDQVNEAGLPTRNGGEPAGSGESADGNSADNDDPSEATSGTIRYDADDGLDSITINGATVASVGQTIAGQYGSITITSIADGAIGYVYTLADNTSGDATADLFTIVVTDDDGDTATATLTIDIVDDVPTARNDTDEVGTDERTAVGNVMSGAGTTSGASGADTVGADNAQVTGVHPGTTGGFTPVTGVGVTVQGQYGSLTLFADGSYVYTRDAGAPDGVTEVFTYQLTDGDGDTSSATLTITIPNFNLPPTVEGSSASVSEEGLPTGLPDEDGEPDTTDQASASGTIGIADPDGDATSVALGEPAGSYSSGGVPIVWTVTDGGHTLTGSAGGATIVTVTIDDAGAYQVALSGPFDHPDPTIEDAIAFTIPVTVSDGTATVPSTIVVTVEDDSPIARDDSPTLTIPIDSLGVDPVSAEWTDTILSSGSPITFDRDGDGLTDEIRWGTNGNGRRSGYGFVDNPVLADDTVLTNQAFSLGTFTHYNNPVGLPELQSTTLTVNFVAHINGQDIPVGPIEINFVHDETTNTGDPEASRDVIMITSATTTIIIEGVEYELQVLGLVAENGDVVTTVRTYEGQRNSYELLVRFVQTDSVELSGDVLANDGSGGDDPIEVVAVAGFGGSADDSADADGNYQVNGQYGVLTLNADGSYTYTLTADVLSVPDGAVEHFVYTIEDFDGDRTSASLDITLDPERTSPVSELVAAPQNDDGAGLDSDGLVAEQRTLSTVVHNGLLSGAIAAAGLATAAAAEPDTSALHERESVFDPQLSGDAGGPARNLAALEGNDVIGDARSNDTPEALDDRPQASIARRGNFDAGEPGSDEPLGKSAEVPADLLQATGPGPSEPAQSTFTSGAVAMPSAAMLAAAAAVAEAGEGQAKSTGEVGRVLADALGGTGDEPGIDALLGAVVDQGPGGNAAAEELASHGAADVPAWDTAGLAGFAVSTTMVTLIGEHPTLHPDAV